MFVEAVGCGFGGFLGGMHFSLHYVVSVVVGLTCAVGLDSWLVLNVAMFLGCCVDCCGCLRWLIGGLFVSYCFVFWMLSVGVDIVAFSVMRRFRVVIRSVVVGGWC